MFGYTSRYGFCSWHPANRISLMSAGIYLHIPFCKSRCSYCDFATDVYRGNDVVERYVTALCKEIKGLLQHVRPYRDASEAMDVIDTIYFGGGTPSLLTPKQLEQILGAVND